MDGVTASAQAAALWAGLGMLLLLGLSSLVVRRRRRHLVAFGDGGVPELAQAIRAFGNATEYLPVGIAALVLLAVLSAPAYLIHGLGGALLFGRVVHAAGLIFLPSSSIGRVVGMMFTWMPLLITAIVLIAYAVV
ncbi:MULTISPECIES: MAPEG family protein [Brevundimonas]|uniref:MAPEG family protein n=1 Tax=Brevundimonas TaxID=41275 RepID=UPI000F03DC1D|nr:MAPEG family protein [Brevundimonas lutea]